MMQILPEISVKVELGVVDLFCNYLCKKYLQLLQKIE